VEGNRAIDKIIDMALLSITGGAEKHLERTFQIQIPDYIPPTFNYKKKLKQK
jgi:hypothetical protein